MAKYKVGQRVIANMTDNSWQSSTDMIDRFHGNVVTIKTIRSEHHVDIDSVYHGMASYNIEENENVIWFDLDFRPLGGKTKRYR